MRRRAGFKVPDLPADRPKVPQVLGLVRSYYEMEGNAAGGNCHVVLDDGNLRVRDVNWALEQCIAADDQLGSEIMRRMLQMSPSQRRRVYQKR